jgi:hypothetical protein
VPIEHAYELGAALAANDIPRAVRVFTHGPHSLGLARDAGEEAIWTTVAERGYTNKPLSVLPLFRGWRPPLRLGTVSVVVRSTRQVLWPERLRVLTIGQ